MQAACKAGPHVLVKGHAQSWLDPFRQQCQIAIAPHIFTAQGKDPSVLMQGAGLVCVIQRRDELAQGQVTGATKKYDVKGGRSGHSDSLYKVTKLHVGEPLVKPEAQPGPVI